MTVCRKRVGENEIFFSHPINYRQMIFSVVKISFINLHLEYDGFELFVWIKKKK